LNWGTVCGRFMVSWGSFLWW